jgi:ABC-type transporter Mla MlaB component
VSAAVNTFLSLPPELTIYTVGALHSEWRAGLADALDSKAKGSECRVRGDRVDEIDAAGVQLLLSLRNSVVAHGCVLRVVDPSARLLAACSALGASLLLLDAAVTETAS